MDKDMMKINDDELENVSGGYSDFVDSSNPQCRSCVYGISAMREIRCLREDWDCEYSPREI